MKISTRTQYGLRALISIAKSKKSFISIREISKKEEIPLAYLEKILTKLEKAKILKAKKGKNGGYKLLLPAQKIKIAKVIKALEGEIIPIRCTVKNNPFCPRQEKCLAKKFWKNFKRSLEKSLNKITLKDLIK